MDQDARQSYLESEGTHCPFCDSENIESGEVHLEGDYFVALVECQESHCGKKWKDIYGLIEVNEVD
jgi:hypothetical protein